MEFRLLEEATITPNEAAAVTRLANLVDFEIQPGDSPIPEAQVVCDLSLETGFRLQRVHGAFIDGALIGVSMLEGTLNSNNADACEVSVAVDPDHRRSGHGRTLCEFVLAEAARHDRTKIHPWGGIDDATKAFWSAMGFDLAYDERISRLDVHDVDPALMQSWIDAAGERASGYHLERWVGRCPDHLIDAYVEAIHGMNEAPVDDLDIEHEIYTPERMRDREAFLARVHRELYVMMCVETATGRGAGYTCVHVRGDRPEHSGQGDTTTLIPHRKRGIGRWLKAAMWQWIRDERPEVRTIDTGNADSNDAMLAINVAMGFREIVHLGVWQQPSTNAPVSNQ